MYFDIQQPPPSTTELGEARRALREKISRSDAQLRDLFQLGVVTTGAVLIAATLLSVVLSGALLGVALGAIELGIALVLLAIAVALAAGRSRIKRRVVVQREAHEAGLKALEPMDMQLDPERYLDLRELAERDPVVQRYLDQVTAANRSAVYGEWRAARDWIAAQTRRGARD